MLLFSCCNIKAMIPTEPGNTDFASVIHAGGGGDYLNCYEFTEEYASEGAEYIELDFAFTSDGYLVCSHQFEHCSGSIKNKPTLAEFMNSDLGGYTPLTAETLMQIMSEYPGFKVVFDTKESDMFSVLDELEKVAAAAGINCYERFIVQFYSYSDYIRLKDTPFSELWFTNYKANYTGLTLQRCFGGEDRVTTIVMSQFNWMFKNTFYMVRGKQIAVHTVNDLSAARFYTERGADVIFCDYWLQ